MKNISIKTFSHLDMISTPSLVPLKHTNVVSALQYSTGVSCLKHMDIYVIGQLKSTSDLIIRLMQS